MEFIQQNSMLITAAVISGGMFLVFTFYRPDNKASLTTTQATLLINREDAVVIDVRQPDEYIAGHLPESRNIPLGQLEERAAELEKFKDSPLIMVCQTGARSDGACKKLEKLGFSKLNNLAGGINAWRDAGLPLKKGTKK
ncbi:MAG: rhodanese-like domain-containing protein [Betaproteobacteria bacterium]